MSDPEVEFLLPGVWRFVPLADPVASKRVIARLAEGAVGRADERARLRADVRSRFTATADRARRAGGEAMWICGEIIPGIPLPASIVLYRPPVVLRRERETTDLRAALRQLVGPAEDGVDEAELVSGGQPAVRRAELLSGPATDEPDPQVVETVECDYWIAQPDGRGVLLLVFACGMPTLQDKLVELFDLIVSTLRWSERTEPVPA